MFLSYIKGFFLKRKLKNIFYEVKSTKFAAPATTVGIVIDESYFLEKKALIGELVLNGILLENIEVIIYKNKVSEHDSESIITIKDVKSNTEIDNVSLNNFINKEFDVLISYYEIEKPLLMLITHRANAKFKVGFTAIDKRLNHLIINTTVDNYDIFTYELFKYLKKIKQN